MPRLPIPRPPRSRLRTKLAAMIALPMIALAALLLTAATVAECRRIEWSEVATTQSIVRAISQDFERLDLLDDQNAAVEIADRLHSFPRIELLAAYDRTGNVVFCYRRPDVVADPPAAAAGEFAGIADGALRMQFDLLGSSGSLAAVYVQSSTEELEGSVRRAAGWMVAVAAAVIVGGIAVALRLERLVSLPILDLERTARRVTTEGDYSLRAVRRSRDEVGNVVDAFNAMLAKMEENSAALWQAHDALESRVAERTATLALANAQLRQEVFERERAETRARAFVDVALDCIVGMDGAGRITEFNPAAEATFGLDRADALGKSVANLLVPARHREAHRRGFERYLATGETSVIGKRIELTALRADGTEFPIEIAIAAVPQQGKAAFIAYLSDISERKEAEDRIRQAHAETQLLLASISSILIRCDARGAITKWNAAAESVLGLREADALGRHISEIGCLWLDRELVSRIGGFLSARAAGRCENVCVAGSDGRERVLSLTVTPIWDDGTFEGLLLLGDDRTEQVQLELHLRQAQKLESIGSLAAGIAHEINSPIQYVRDNTYFLRDGFTQLCTLLDEYAALHSEAEAGPPRPESLARLDAARRTADADYLLAEVPSALSQSLEGLEQVASIVRAMKEMSHPGSSEKALVNLNENVLSTITVTRNEWKYVADLRTDLDPDLPAVNCLAGDVNQAVVNLIVNAAHAIGDANRGGPNKGTITIRTRREGDEVEIQVADTGTGIPEAIRSRVFDPFFTTKGVGKGTGQGLAITRAVVEQKHGGRIWFETRSGRGTTFFVRLPLAIDGATALAH